MYIPISMPPYTCVHTRKLYLRTRTRDLTHTHEHRTHTPANKIHICIHKHLDTHTHTHKTYLYKHIIIHTGTHTHTHTHKSIRKYVCAYVYYFNTRVKREQRRYTAKFPTTASCHVSSLPGMTRR